MKSVITKQYNSQYKTKYTEMVEDFESTNPTLRVRQSTEGDNLSPKQFLIIPSLLAGVGNGFQNFLNSTISDIGY